MAITISIDIYHRNEPKDCIAIDMGGNTVYIVWEELSLYDQQVIGQAQSTLGDPLPWTGLQTYFLPNGMPFLTTYKFIMKAYPAKPEGDVYDYDSIYYDDVANVWKRLSTGVAV